MSEIRWLAVSAATALAAYSVAAPTRATQYATFEEAAKRSFPDATSFKEAALELTTDQQRAIAKATGLPQRAVQWKAMVALGGRATLGVVVIDAVIGKFELIDFAVGISADGKIRNVEILTYRESHGYEVRLPAWRKQFAGKTKADKLRVDDDINNISGATMSATNVTDGVRRIVAVVEALKSANKI